MYILEWNPAIKPKYRMVDFDAAEILSIGAVFPNIKIFLCDFHREHSWNRQATVLASFIKQADI